MSLKRKSQRQKENRGIPGPTMIPAAPPRPGGQSDQVYQVGFTIPEIDQLMTTLIDLNVPIQTYMFLDRKFNKIKRKSLGLPLVGGGTQGKKESITVPSKMNQEVQEIPDWDKSVEYKEGDRFVRRDPFGVFQIIKGKEIEITVNDDSANGPGETN